MKTKLTKFKFRKLSSSLTQFYIKRAQKILKKFKHKKGQQNGIFFSRLFYFSFYSMHNPSFRCLHTAVAVCVKEKILEEFFTYFHTTKKSFIFKMKLNRCKLFT